MTRQKAFYKSAAWRRLAGAYMASKNYICERCGEPASICHHKIHLDEASVGDPGIALSWDNLEALCLACHNQEHLSMGGATAEGLMFDRDGNLIKAGGKVV